MVNINRENRRYGRVIIEKGLRVSMRSIGSEASYNMETRNVSDTGFFLRFEKPGRFPFTPSSIMEVWLTLEEGSTIFFNGRMTRVVYPDEAVSLDTEPGIAIRIVQIEKEEENILREFIRKKALENEDNKRTASSSLPAKEEAAGALLDEEVQVGRKKTRRTATKKKTVTSKKTSRKTASRKKKVESITAEAPASLPPLPVLQEDEDKAS